MTDSTLYHFGNFVYFCAEKKSSPGGLELPTFRVTAERANQLRHGDNDETESSVSNNSFKRKRNVARWRRLQTLHTYPEKDKY